MLYTYYIESDEDVVLGKPVIKGTRITWALVLKKFTEGVPNNNYQLPSMVSRKQL